MGEDDWEKKGAKGRFAKTQFRYDEHRDAYVCPANEVLSYADRGNDGRGRRYRRYRTPACAHCPVRVQCTTGQQGRSLSPETCYIKHGRHGSHHVQRNADGVQSAKSPGDMRHF
jgi:hypothetical protein